MTTPVYSTGFETDSTGWTTGGTNTLARSQEQAHDGTWSIKVTYADSTNLADFNSFTTTPVSNDGSVWVYVPTDWDGGQIQFNPIAFTGVGFGATYFADMGLRDQWQRIGRFFTPVSGDLSGGIRVSAATAPTAGRSIYIDDALVSSLGGQGGGGQGGGGRAGGVPGGVLGSAPGSPSSKKDSVVGSRSRNRKYAGVL